MIDKVLILTRSDLLDDTYKGGFGFIMHDFKLLPHEIRSKSNIIVFVDNDGSLHVLKNRRNIRGKSSLSELVAEYNTSAKA